MRYLRFLVRGVRCVCVHVSVCSCRLMLLFVTLLPVLCEFLVYISCCTIFYREVRPTYFRISLCVTRLQIYQNFRLCWKAYSSRLLNYIFNRSQLLVEDTQMTEEGTSFHLIQFKVIWKSTWNLSWFTSLLDINVKISQIRIIAWRFFARERGEEGVRTVELGPFDKTM